MFKPMKADKVDYAKVKYPVLASPKLDGIRCLMVDGKAMSISGKPIPNQYAQRCLSGLHGLDGELMVNGDFNDVQSAIMKSTGEPDFTYHVFDCWHLPSRRFVDRLEAVREIIKESLNAYCQVVTHRLLHDEPGLRDYHAKATKHGYEGTMIRDPNGIYKNGRSTVREGIVLKIKNFSDTEGVLVDIIEQMTNTNAKEKDELGYSKRSSAKAGKVPAGTAGKMIIIWNGIEFGAGFGPGITAKIKKEMWDDRNALIGKTAKFSYQNLSKDGVPRLPKFLCFRDEDDL